MTTRNKLYYACIATGPADFAPDDQAYICAPNLHELRECVAGHCERFEEEEGEEEGCYRYAFRPPSSPDNTNWSQRLRITRGDRDRVLDVIGMDEATWWAQQGE